MAITAASPAPDAADPGDVPGFRQPRPGPPTGNDPTCGFRKVPQPGSGPRRLLRYRRFDKGSSTHSPANHVSRRQAAAPPAPTTNSFRSRMVIPVGAIPIQGPRFRLGRPRSRPSFRNMNGDRRPRSHRDRQLRASRCRHVSQHHRQIRRIERPRLDALTLDNGPGAANSVMIHDFTLTQTFGAACTPVLKNAASFPLLLGNLGPNQTGTTTAALDFTGCAASVRFTAKFTYSANNGAVSGFVTRTNQYQ